MRYLKFLRTIILASVVIWIFQMTTGCSGERTEVYHQGTFEEGTASAMNSQTDPSALPEIACSKIPRDLSLSGKIEDPLWKEAEPHQLLNAITGRKEHFATEVRALCDIVEEKVARGQSWVKEAGQAKPEGYTKGDYDFKRLCDHDDLDLVVTATPWEGHVPVCVAAMERGKHAFTEVPAAVTIDECWQMVETSEKTRRHCVMMENCCYGRAEMMVLNMVRQGLLGELLHCEAGYLHDLRAGKTRLVEGNKIRWRTMHSIKRDGNLYPTHGLGPVSQCMNINRGDQFDYLISMSCKSRGLNVYAEQHYGSEHPMARMKSALGDVNTSLIRTKNGLTITLGHDSFDHQMAFGGQARDYMHRTGFIPGFFPHADGNSWSQGVG